MILSKADIKKSQFHSKTFQLYLIFLPYIAFLTASMNEIPSSFLLQRFSKFSFKCYMLFWKPNKDLEDIVII